MREVFMVAEDRTPEDTSIQVRLQILLMRVFQRIKDAPLESWILVLIAPIILGTLSILHVLLTMQAWGVYGFSFDDSCIPHPILQSSGINILLPDLNAA